MPEILTESFCERCGTRYTFESTGPTKVRRLGRFKTLSKGLKNYVMSDDTSLDEALAAARNDDERELTAQQLDAFHSTFNFCMTCRQYTCGNCWNQAEGRCLTCAPHLGHEIMPAPFPDLPELAPDQLRFDASAWPTTDLATERNGADALAPGAASEDPELEFDLSARLAQFAGERNGNGHVDEVPAESQQAAPDVLPAAEAVDAFAPEPAPAGDAQPAVDVGVEAEPETAAAAEVEIGALEPQDAAVDAASAIGFDAADEPGSSAADTVAETFDEPAVEPVTAEAAAPAEPLAADAEPVLFATEPAQPAEPASIDDRAAAASQQTASLLAKFRPGQNIDAELEAFEASLPSAAETVAEPDAASSLPETEAASAFAAEPAPEPQPAVDVVPEFIAEPAHEPVAATAEPEPAAAAPEPVAWAAEPEPAAAAFEPESELEPEAVAWAAEPEPVAAAPEPEPEPLVAAAPELELDLAAAPEPEPEPVQPIAATPAPEAVVPAPAPIVDQPEPAAPAPEPLAASAAPEPTPEAPPTRSDVVEQPTWRIVAPEPTVPLPPTPPAAPAIPSAPATDDRAPAAASAQAVEPAAEPNWPAAPQWPGASADVSFLAERVAARSAATDALWAASARDVVAQTPANVVGGVQPCANCGLSLSATARFCRRCGSRQGG